MKISRNPVLFVVSLCAFVSSCQKIYSDSIATNSRSSTSSSLIKIKQGLDIADDTTSYITYDSLKRIRTIIDSAYQDTSFVSYDLSNRLSQVIDKYNGVISEPTSYKYGAGGNLVQIDFKTAGIRQRYVFEYVNGTVSRKLYYSDNFNGSALQLFTIYAYTLSGGN